MKTTLSIHQLYAKPILFVGLLLLLAGIYGYTRMQTNLFPEVLFPRITVIADAGQQPVDRMMITVTKPLESAVKKVPGAQMQQPLAVAVIGGFVVGLPLLLVVLPEDIPMNELWGLVFALFPEFLYLRKRNNP